MIATPSPPRTLGRELLLAYTRRPGLETRRTPAMLRSRLGPYLRSTTSSLRTEPSFSTSSTRQPAMYPSCWRISAMCVFSLDDGIAAESWYAELAFRNRVSMSAIGSVIVMGCRASLAAVPRALGLGDLAPGLSAIVEGPRPSQPSHARAEPLDEAIRGGLPAGLAHARQLAGVGHLPQADA